jgi:uncharacterized protein (TIGR03067 family)
MYAWLGILSLLLVPAPFSAGDAFAGPPAKRPSSESSDAEKAEYRRFHGIWRVASANYQLEGAVTFTFGDGTLVVTSHSSPKPGYAPEEDSVLRYHFRLDISHDPKQIVITPIGGKSKTAQKKIYEFRDGMLWMCPDDGPTPKDRTSLDSGRSGDGWLEGLEPVKSRRREF